MTDLSPAAQAVLSAWAKPVDVDRSLVINGKALEFQARGALAAALRAAAEELQYRLFLPGTDPMVVDAKALFNLANELEGGND